MYSAFGDFNEPQSAAFGPQKHRKLFFNPETLRWEPIEAEDEAAYDKAYAGNSARGAFKMLGIAQGTGPDTSSEQERGLLSPQGQPEFYGGTDNNTGPLAGLRAYLAQEAAARQKKERGY